MKRAFYPFHLDAAAGNVPKIKCFNALAKYGSLWFDLDEIQKLITRVCYFHSVISL